MVFFFFYFYKIIQLRILNKPFVHRCKNIFDTKIRTSPQYLQAKEKRERDKGFAYEKARIMRISKQRILKRKRKKEEKKYVFPDSNRQSYRPIFPYIRNVIVDPATNNIEKFTVANQPRRVHY